MTRRTGRGWGTCRVEPQRNMYASMNTYADKYANPGAGPFAEESSTPPWHSA